MDTSAEDKKISLKFFIETVYDNKINNLEKIISEKNKYYELLIDKLLQKIEHNEKSNSNALINKAEEYKNHFERLNGEYKRIDFITAAKVSIDKYEGLVKTVEDHRNIVMKMLSDIKSDTSNFIQEKIENINIRIAKDMAIIHDKLELINRSNDLKKGSGLVNEKYLDKIIYIIITVLIAYIIFELKLK